MMSRASALLTSLALLAACPAPTPQGGPAKPVKPTPVDTEPPAPETPPPPPPELRLDASLAAPLSYSAQLSLDAEAESFDGLVLIDLELRKPARYLWLNAVDIDVDRATVRGAAGARTIGVSRSSESTLVVDLGAETAPGRMTLELSYSGKVGGERAYEGVFAQAEDFAGTGQPKSASNNKRKYLYTQFEANGARRAFPCFDQPEFKTPWTLKITAPRGQLAFANTPEVKTEDLGDKTAFTFAASKPIPSYLVAFAVGPFEIVDIGTAGRKNTPMRIIVPRGRKHQTAHAAATIKIALGHLESYFDIAYPYAKLDSIALPHFFGAMENPGLITYAASILLVEPGSETDRFRRAHLNIVAHELAHQWFGNLVTLRWWDDLWLNESFASWMAAKVVEQMRPSWDAAVGRVETRDGAMDGDARDSTRPVRKNIDSPEDMLGVFDAGITYGKGSSVISMFEAWIGEDKFRAGMREYMRTHAWKTTTAADFFASLAKVSNEALPVAFATFIDQSGVPLVTAELECQGRDARLTLSQSRFLPSGSKATPESRRWQIPACVRYEAGGERRVCKLLEGQRTTLELEGDRCPRWLVANADSTGYYRVRYQDALLSKLMRASNKLTTAERIGVIGDVEALMASGQVKVADALGLIPKLLRDRNDRIVGSAAGIAKSIDDQVPEALWDNYERFITRSFVRRARKLGLETRAGESSATAELRRDLVELVALIAEDRRLLAEAKALATAWLADPKAIDGDMLEVTLRAAARTSGADLYDALRARADKTKDARARGRILGALAEFNDPALIARTLTLLVGDELPLRATFGLLQRLLLDRRHRAQAYKYIVDNLDAITAKLPAMAQGFMALAPVPFCDEAHKADIDAIFAVKLAKVPGIDRSLKRAHEEIDQCMAQRSRQAPQIRAFLERY